MVRWSDLGAGLHGSLRAMGRWDFWREVVQRALFSRVFAGYAVVGVLFLLAGWAALEGQAGGLARHTGVLLLVLLAAPVVLGLAGVLLLPYAAWAVQPAAARVLQDYLRIPPPDVEDEPPFLHYFLWSVPLLLVSLLLVSASLLPGLGHGLPHQVFQLLALALVLLAVLKMLVRTALAAHYPREAVDEFLAATRRQRSVAWMPVALLFAWLAEWLAHALVGGLGLESRGADAQRLFGGWLLALLLQLGLAGVAAIAFTGALLLACGRLVAPPETATATAVATDIARGEALTRPMSSGEVRALHRDIRRQVRRRRRRRFALVATFALATAAGAGWLARLPLTDWYFAQDAMYARATDILQRQLPHSLRIGGRLLDPGVREERLRAGYIVYGCTGEFERASWLRWLDVPQESDHGRLLACAACTGAKPSVSWLLQEEPTLRTGAIILATDAGGRQERTALSCAARANDLALARQLLARGASPRELRAPFSALHVAAAQQHWDMLRLLLQNDPSSAPAATFAALDAAYARDPRRPAEMLPRMQGAGLSLQAVDRNGRNLFHWAAARHDLALGRALLQLAAGNDASHALTRPDRQGALPWMLVLRKAEIDGQPLSADATELLRLMLPPGADVNAVLLRPADHGTPEAFPPGWNAGAASINQPAAREVLGPALDFGLLPQDTGGWWKFTSAQQAQEFVRTASAAQLLRAENPDAPAGLPPKKLSTALADAGWPELASQVQAGARGRRR